MSVAEALRAALDGRPTVVLGNMIDRAEELYGPALGGDGPAYWLDDARRYSEVSTLLAPNLALVILPAAVPDWAIGLQTELLGIERPPAVATGVGMTGPLCRAVQARSDLIEQISACGAPLLPWSATGSYDELCAMVGEEESGQERVRSRVAADHFESKVNSNELFDRLAGDHQGVRVPHQDHPTSAGSWVEFLEVRRRQGRRAIAKSEYGQAGYGSTFIDADDPRPVPRLVEELLNSDVRFRTGRPSIEQVITPAEKTPFVTVDMVVLGPHEVVIAGAGEMLISGGTHYDGVKFGPDALSEHLRRVAERFAKAVGEAVGVRGYVGWCCVDLIHGDDGYLWPTEINMRMTGSAIAVTAQRRLSTTSGALPAAVASDQHPLPRRMGDAELRDWFGEAKRMGSGAIGVAPTITSNRDAPTPSIGLIITGPSINEIDAYLTALPAEGFDRRAR